MHADTIATRRSVATQLRALTQHGQPKVQICLESQPHGYMGSYTTHDTIRGEVVVTTAREARFDHVQIDLEGCTTTFLARAGPSPANVRSPTQHTFLRMRQPIDDGNHSETALSPPRMLEAGRVYRFSFTFVVPDRLLPVACQHACESQLVHDAHLQLPPSLGDRDVAGDDGGRRALDDLAPAMTRVVYSIQAALTRTRGRHGAEVAVVVGQASRKIRIIPATAELPPPPPPPPPFHPLHPGLAAAAAAADDPTTSMLQAHKTIKRGLFVRKRLGCLSIEAAPPRSLALSAATTTTTTTMVSVILRFEAADPTAGSPPPRLGRLVSRLRATTHFASEPATGLVPLAAADHGPVVGGVGGGGGGGGGNGSNQRGAFSETVHLSSRCMASARWEAHDPTTTTTMTTMTTAHHARFYTCRLLVPVSLPTHKNKAWLPTFHSCLVSRVYALELSLSVTASASASASSSPSWSCAAIANIVNATTTIALRLPLQICSSSSASFDVADITDPFFRPRRLVSPPPPSSFSCRSPDPPRSSSFAAAAAAAPAVHHHHHHPVRIIV
ncbi:MAG: hypothetical protein M1826_007284 [Phylliscum demangeonii]|nr:MAG: hypothetical protein M1826_007284 [Phylliscum demangeonii]